MVQHVEITDAQAVALAGQVISRLSLGGVEQRKRKGDKRAPVEPKFHTHSKLILNVDMEGVLHFQTPLMEEPFVYGVISPEGQVSWRRKR